MLQCDSDESDVTTSNLLLLSLKRPQFPFAFSFNRLQSTSNSPLPTVLVSFSLSGAESESLQPQMTTQFRLRVVPCLSGHKRSWPCKYMCDTEEEERLSSFYPSHVCALFPCHTICGFVVSAVVSHVSLACSFVF